MAKLAQFAVVALLHDKPADGLVRGQVGTIVEELAPNTYLVDFSDDDGYTYALATLRTDELIQLHHRRLEQVA